MTISDANGSTVRQLIRYLYTGRLVSTDENPLSLDQLIDLLILSDRFEVDSLKDCCQERMKSCIEEKSVTGLLFIADHYTAGNLRVSPLSYQGPGLISLERFEGQTSETEKVKNFDNCLNT